MAFARRRRRRGERLGCQSRPRGARLALGQPWPFLVGDVSNSAVYSAYPGDGTSSRPPVTETVEHRVVRPATGNLLIGLLKATSIVSVIAVQDLLYSVQLICQQNFLVMPLLMVATLWYIILTTVLSIGQYFAERHYGRGSHRDRRPGRGLREIAQANLPVFGRTRRDLAGLA